MFTSSDQKARGWGGGLNALCQYQQLPNLDLSRRLGGSSLVTAVGINRDFCCWQADVSQVMVINEKAGNKFKPDSDGERWKPCMEHPN